MVKDCTDKYGYGCTFSLDSDDDSEIAKHFYMKKTHTGDFFMNVCKTCVKRYHREKFKSGEYNWRMRNSKKKTYSDKDFAVGREE